MSKFFGKVKLSFKEDLEPNEILLDRLANKKEEEMGFSERKFEIPIFGRAIEALFFCSLFILFLLFAKTFQLQIVAGKSLSQQAEDNKFIYYQLRAERGVIYDNALNQLVFNRPSFDLVLEKSRFPESDSEKSRILNDISQILKISLKDLQKKIGEANGQEVLIAENLDHQALIILETKIKELQGFQIENSTTREYVDGENYAHLLGYTGKIRSDEFKASPGLYFITDEVGRSGVEAAYEEVLRKNFGQVKVERDARGNIISKETVGLPQPGKSLVLWLDSVLQKKIEEELKRELGAVGSSRGVAVAIDPKTGGILAMVSLPSFDNNIFPRGDQKEIEKVLNDARAPLFNRVISGQYPTGSSIKPLMASAALEEKIISPEKQIYSPGYIEVPNRYDPEIVYKFLDQAPPNWYDIRKAIAFSSNVFFYTIGGGYKDQKGLGPTRIKRYLELFGWGQDTNIDLPGEASGFLPSPEWKQEVKKEGWWDGDTYNMSIGQGNILATPLQLALAISSVANGGKLLEPKVVKEVLGVGKIESEVIRESFIKPENLQVVREGMRQAVTLGSAAILNSLPVRAAAKTGTAQTSRTDYYHNWVTVFAPYDDPQIVLTILIENVRGIHAAALPVAKEVLNWYFSSK